MVALEFLVEDDEASAHLVGRAHRPERVVLVGDRDTEDRHHRIADELLDRSAVASSTARIPAK